MSMAPSTYINPATNMSGFMASNAPNTTLPTPTMGNGGLPPLITRPSASVILYVEALRAALR